MRVLIFHGYLLRGTGSNVYNASLARALAGLGHEVHLLCQDRAAGELDWVGGSGPGSVTVHVPEIGGLLPVYVADRYEGFEVKTFPELSEAELDRYLAANVEAVRAVVEDVGEPDAALANHLIMGPVILARAGLRYAIKVHGSDLSYTVMPHPERFVPYAREGTDAASGLLVGSRHTAEDLWRTIPDPGLPARTRLGPPGVDTREFRSAPEAEALAGVVELAEEIAGEPPDESFGRDGPAAAAALREWAGGSPRVLFVGKLLRNKGVDLLVSAWPQVRRAHPGARLLLAGFGELRDSLAEQISELDGPTAASISISGRLEHSEVGRVMPAAQTLVMPSVFPEAFGMVAAEAAACGVPPVSAAHSGMLEVSSELAEAVPEHAELLSFEVGPGSVEAIAERVNGWLALPAPERLRVGEALAARVDELWSWERVAEGVIAASRGELERLAPVPSGGSD
ncbi:MAG: glycosyltransferase family 4 protein [Actinobacteria bacterium]|nr:glycosyltransferase family 4 protein [Actinomycetota bacterium]